jgi:hypothetical protein
MSPPPLVELALAYRQDDPLPTLTNLLRLVDELATTGAGSLPEDGELI